MPWRSALMLAAALASARSAWPQVDTVSIDVEAITVEDGLPQGYVIAMAQDSTGYLWFGTKDGLARYDGYGFTVFRHDERDPGSIGGDHINSLLVDREGTLWVAFAPAGLDRYDPRTGRFAHVRFEQLPDDMGVANAARLQVDAQARVWMNVVAPSGWFTVVVDTRRPGELVAVSPEQLQPPIAPLRNAVVGVGPEGDVWFSNRDTIRCAHEPGDGSVVNTDLPHGFSWHLGDGVRQAPDLIPDPARKHMLAFSTGVVLRLMADRAVPIDTMRLAEDLAQSVSLVGRRGQLWCANRSAAEARIDLATGEAQVLRYTGQVLGQAPSSNGLKPFFEDRAGNIWFGTNGFGVCFAQARHERFQKPFGPMIWGLLPGDLEGRALLSSARPGQAIPIHDDAPGHAFRRLHHHVPECISRSVLDDQGRLWVAEVVAGSRRLRTVILDNGRRTVVAGLVNDRVSDMHPGLDQSLWLVSTTDDDMVKSLVHVDMRSASVIRRYEPPIRFGSADYLSVASMTHAPDGTLWMGTVSGLHHLDPVSGAWTVFRHDASDPHSLPHDMVFTTCLDPVDPEHLLWVGTNGGGLARFDRRTGQFTRYTAEDGLPNEVVYSILSDARHNLWIGTNQGLVRFDPRTGSMVTYTKEDGLPSNEFNRYSYAKASNGELWFEGMGGTFHFNPEEFYEPIAASPTVITGLKLVGKSVAVAGLGSVAGDAYELPAPIEFVRSITLPYRERMISFSFACMDHTAPLKNSFRYRLEGFSKGWVDAGTQHEATFTNLDPGTYTFRVQGRNSAGVWDERGASVQLIITPPWWRTWWFRIGVVLVAAGSLYAFYRYRLAQAVKVVRVRERIARDLHDEIGSTLSSVQLYSAVAQRKTKGAQPEAHELLGRITESTTAVMESMNDIVWAVNADNDDMGQLVRRMNSHAERMRAVCNCELRFEVQEGMASKHLGMTQRKNLYLIYKEAVNNAVKYARCKALHVELRREGPGYLLRVHDDGVGFDAGAAARADNLGGNGLGNMRRRAAEMGARFTVRSAPGAGTTIELRFEAVADAISEDPMSRRRKQRR